MNVIFFVFVTASVVYMIFTDPDGLLPAMIGGGKNALTFAISLSAIYSVWSIVLTALERTGVNKGVGKVLSLPIKWLFPDENELAREYLSVNLTANLLGTGGAATPMGIKAIETMKSRKNRIMLAVINSTSIQLIPTTILGLRAEYGAVEDVILPSLLTTFLTTAIGILLVKVFVGEK